MLGSINLFIVVLGIILFSGFLAALVQSQMG